MLFVDYILPIIIMTIGAWILGFILSFIADKLAVKNDQLYDQVKAIVGDINCGACGYSGCAGYTQALVSFQDELGKCRPMKKAAFEQIDKILKDAKAETLSDKN